VAHLQLAAADAHRVAVVQPACRREGLGVGEAEHAALLRQRVDPELVGLVRAFDGQAERARQRAGGAGVVDVRVREPDLLEREAELLHGGEQHLDVAAGVDHGGLVRGVVPDQRAVLLEGCDGDGAVAEAHGRQW